MARLLPQSVIHSSVQTIGALLDNGIWVFGDGQPFLISALYEMDDELVDYGATPNSVGEMYAYTNPQGALVHRPQFRRPKENEIVILDRENLGEHGGGGNLRWGGSAWESYRTLPQKALDAQGVFALFDRDGIYDYYAELLGNLHAQHMADTRNILTFLDPQSVPQEFLPHLAATFGAEGITTVNITPEEFRAMLSGVLALHKGRGTPQSVVLALRNLGYIGYMMEVWVDPANPANNFEEVASGQVANNPDYYPSSAVVIHLADLAGGEITPNAEESERIASYLKMNILPAATQIRDYATP
jgi:hypothetical protein